MTITAFRTAQHIRCIASTFLVPQPVFQLHRLKPRIASSRVIISLSLIFTHTDILP